VGDRSWGESDCAPRADRRDPLVANALTGLKLTL